MMSAYTTHSASVAGDNQDGSDGSSSDEGGSPLRPDGSGRLQASFWTRAARMLRPNQGSTLREDLTDALMADGGPSEAFTPEERAMLHNILRCREVRVEDIMVPRADIEAVDLNISIGELFTIFEESGRSRMPVYRETLDDPRGMVHIRDLMSYVAKQARNRRRVGTRPGSDDGAEGSEKIEKPARSPAAAAKAAFDLARVDLNKTVAEAGIIRSILFVPPSMQASDLLSRMQAARTQIALVIDEYGGTDGLVSHEDIVEMVIGDIDDEHDDEEAMFSKTSDDVIVADARIELEEIARAIGADFDIRDQVDDIDTLGGLIFSALGRIPVRGEVVQALPGFEFHILDADPRRIKRVRITRKRPAARRRPTKGEIDASVAPVGAATKTELPPSVGETDAAGSRSVSATD